MRVSSWSATYGNSRSQTNQNGGEDKFQVIGAHQEKNREVRHWKPSRNDQAPLVPAECRVAILWPRKTLNEAIEVRGIARPYWISSDDPSKLDARV